MANYYVNSGSGTANSGTFRGIFATTATYALGDRVVPTRAFATASAKGFIYECTTAGLTGASEPTWVTTTPGTSTTTSGTAVFTCRDCITWANANIFTDYISNRAAAGDAVYISQASSESVAATVTASFVGTNSSPNRIICANDGAAPPTSVSTAGIIAVTGVSNYNLYGAAYIYGLTFNLGSGANASSMQTSATDNTSQYYEKCNFSLLSTVSTNKLQLGSANAATENAVTLDQCGIKFANASQGIGIGHCPVKIKGGSILSGSTALTSGLFISSADVIDVTVSDFDFTNLGSSASMIVTAMPCGGKITFNNCKPPTSWTGGLVGGAPLNSQFRASMYNCDPASTNYRLWIETQAGSIKSETTLVKSGGATDGTTALSWKMVSLSTANEPILQLISDPISIKNTVTGSTVTVTIDILHDSVTALTNSDIWVEIDYRGTSGNTLGINASNRRADLLTTASNHGSSSATWTTTGMTNPNKQTLVLAITPQQAGPLYARVFLAKPSYTIYIDPKPVLT